MSESRHQQTPECDVATDPPARGAGCFQTHCQLHVTCTCLPCKPGIQHAASYDITQHQQDVPLHAHRRVMPQPSQRTGESPGVLCSRRHTMMVHKSSPLYITSCAWCASTSASTLSRTSSRTNAVRVCVLACAQQVLGSRRTSSCSVFHCHRRPFPPLVHYADAYVLLWCPGSCACRSPSYPCAMLDAAARVATSARMAETGCSGLGSQAPPGVTLPSGLMCKRKVMFGG
jgi:hypothetical protein